MGKKINILIIFFVAVFAIILFTNSVKVFALPPLPPTSPGEPEEVPSCNITNNGIEICDLLDNDCDGSIDEELTCNQNDTSSTTQNSDNIVLEENSQTESTQKKSRGGGEGSGGSSSSRINYFSDSNSPPVLMEESELSSDSLDESSKNIDENIELTHSLINPEEFSSSNVDSSSTDSEKSQNISKSYFNVIFNDYKGMFIASFIFLVVSIFIIVFIIKKNIFKKNDSSKDNSDDSNLSPNELKALNFINGMRKNKYSEDQIKLSMKKSGWTDKEIDKLTRKNS